MIPMKSYGIWNLLDTSGTGDFCHDWRPSLGIFLLHFQQPSFNQDGFCFLQNMELKVRETSCCGAVLYVCVLLVLVVCLVGGPVLLSKLGISGLRDYLREEKHHRAARCSFINSTYLGSRSCSYLVSVHLFACCFTLYLITLNESSRILYRKRPTPGRPLLQVKVEKNDH